VRAWYRRWVGGLAVALVCWVPPVGAAPGASSSQAALPAQVVDIDVRGAAALVTVTRTLPGARRAGDAREEILDLALPRDARLLDVDVDASGRFDSARPSPGARARDGYVEATRALGITPRVLSFDDETTTRVRVALRQQKPNQSTSIRYRFSTLVHVAGRRAQLAFPPTPDAPGPPARVTVRASIGQDVASIAIADHVHPIARGAAAVAIEPELSTDRAWMVTLGLDREQARSSAAPSPARFTALAARVPKTSATGATSLACAVGLTPAAPQELPDRVLFLIDRSRSVGPGGLEAERDAAKRLLLALPPATMWNAMFFDRGQAQLFPAPRTATRQTMTALDDEMVTARLANGTDLTGALKAAGELLRREPAAFGPRALLVILSDGAVGRLTGRAAPLRTAAAPGASKAAPPSQGSQPIKERASGKATNPVAPAGADFLAAVPGVELMIAALSVRPNDDPPVSPDERRSLQAVAGRGRLGGIERALRVGELETALPEALAALRLGGDAFALRLDVRDGPAVAPAISPGSGTATILSVKNKARSWSPAALLAETGAQTHSVPLHVVNVDKRWLARPPTTGSEARLFVGPAVAALVEPVGHPGVEAEPLGPSGFLERSVVRDALSLAFRPRARACYLNRSAATPADRDLTGRVRLAIDLIRGEVNDARVESSTLRRPAIEDCLREAAFAFNVPRTYRNDERVTAVLNLVFRPRSPDKPPAATEPGVSREIDLLVDGALGTGGAGGLSAAEQAKALLAPAPPGVHRDDRGANEQSAGEAKGQAAPVR